METEANFITNKVSYVVSVEKFEKKETNEPPKAIIKALGNEESAYNKHDSLTNSILKGLKEKVGL